jgi:porin
VRRRPIAGAAAFLLAAPVPVTAAPVSPPPPPWSLSARETLDLWDNVAGGVRTGPVLLNKIQVSGTVNGEPIGLPGLSVHAQVFRTDSASLSSRVGDIQTVTNIEAVPTYRLFEAWIEKRFGGEGAKFALRAGLMDLNSDFDSVQTSSLFINSSHGIGPDVARSGRNGPSIFPVSAAGVRASWLPSEKWTFRIAAFDGVPGDPDHPRAFVKIRLVAGDGALLIAQGDYHISDASRVEAGVWRYTVPIAANGLTRKAPDQGAYASIEGPVPSLKGWSAWLRGGIANADAQIVSNYLGTGLVAQGLLSGRPDDRLGLAVARAGIGPARFPLALHRAETTVELSYQYKVHDTFAMQPDVQYVHHPAGVARGRDALVLGLRIVVTAGYPRKAPAADATDPTVPPDGPQPPDTGQQPSPH